MIIGTASFKFGSVASFLTLSLLERNFPEGWGVFDKLWKIRRGGGVIAYFKKWKIRGGGGVLSEIPSVVGVWIFSGTTHSGMLT